MKVLRLLLLTGLIVLNLNYIYSQPTNNGSGELQFVDRLCYTESSTNSIRVTGEVDLTTLSISDKIRFVTKEYVNNHVEYIDTEGYSVHDVYTVSHENVYPQWYTKAYLIRKSNEGVFSYYTSDSQYLSGGWVGATTSNTENGTYATDSRTRENYYHQDYTSRSLEVYQRYNNAIITHGILYRHRWYMPPTVMYQQFQSEGYTVTIENNILTITNPKTTMIWDEVRKTYIIQIIENETIVKTTTYYYEYIVEFDEYLLTQNTISVPQIFDNGDCFTDIETIVYTNYNNCGMNEMRIIENNNTINAEKKMSFIEKGFSISPNPVTERLAINLPIIDSDYKIIVTDINGKTLLQRRAKGNNSAFDVNTSFFHKGIYILKIVHGQDIYSTKFVKQ